MHKPRISVLLPAYNAERYLREAVESILAQTYTDFELLLLNDGSTDRTEQVALSLNDKRIRYIANEQNLGLANTLNKGMAMAQGEFIARMDADDISLPTRFAVQVDYLDAHPEVMLCSCAIQQFGAADHLMVGRSDFEQVKVDMLFSSAIGHASSMWRREAFSERGLQFEQAEFPAEDYGLWTRAVFEGTMVNIPDVLYRYRIYPEQVTATDKRSYERCRQIQRGYMLRICPQTDTALLDSFLRLFADDYTYSEWQQATRFVSAFCAENRFLQPERLRRALYSWLWQKAKEGATRPAEGTPQRSHCQRLRWLCQGYCYRLRRAGVRVF